MEDYIELESDAKGCPWRLRIQTHGVMGWRKDSLGRTRSGLVKAVGKANKMFVFGDAKEIKSRGIERYGP